MTGPDSSTGVSLTGHPATGGRSPARSWSLRHREFAGDLCGPGSRALRRQWRSIFLINMPVGILAWALAWRFLPHKTGENANALLDLGGVALLTLASALLIIPLVQGRELSWPLWT